MFVSSTGHGEAQSPGEDFAAHPEPATPPQGIQGAIELGCASTGRFFYIPLLAKAVRYERT